MHRHMRQRAIIHNAQQPQQRFLRNSSFLTTLQRNVIHTAIRNNANRNISFVKPDSELEPMHALLRAQWVLEPCV